MELKECGKSILRHFEYNTPLVLHTSSKTIGVIFRLLQLFICIFIFAYYIGYKRGYQAVSYTVISSARITRKDVTQKLANEIGIPVNDRQVEGERIFYPTFATIITQIKDICPEDPGVPLASCDPSSNTCPSYQLLLNGNGITTGKCVPARVSRLSSSVPSSHTCEINGWCTEMEINKPLMQMLDMEKMSVIIENDVYFPEFPTHGNLNNYAGSTASCWTDGHYYSAFHPLCPLFKLQTIADEASKVPGTDPYTFEQLAETGGVLSVRIMWDCNFDVHDPNKQCDIKYKFRRLDRREDLASKSADMTYSQAQGDLRTLINLYGIHLIVSVEGVGRQFNLFTFLTRLGASAGLFAMAAVFCEFLLMFACCPSERQTRSMKYVSPGSTILTKV